MVAAGTTTSFAATLGAPTFRLADASIGYLNNFFLGEPSNIITLTISGTISSSIGAPGLVEQNLILSVLYDEFDGMAFDTTLSIGGVAIDTLSDTSSSFLMSPPLASDTENPDGTFTFEYAGLFAPFGPRTDDFPEFPITFVIESFFGSSTKLFRLFCEAGDDGDCTPGNTADGSDTGLTNPVLAYEYTYTEGSGTGAVTFYTEGGAPLPPVPLPAAGWALLAGLGALGLMRRRT